MQNTRPFDFNINNNNINIVKNINNRTLNINKIIIDMKDKTPEKKVI